MTNRVVVLGAGYAGTEAVMRLQRKAPDDVSLTWISEDPYHCLRHEIHRVVRRPAVRTDITVPMDRIADADTTTLVAEVTGVRSADRDVELGDGRTVPYDDLIVALGSEPAYYGIDGLHTHAVPLSTLDHAMEIHRRVEEIGRSASRDDPGKVVVGGGGLSGIQTAGEIAAYRDEHDVPIDVTLVEALRTILPNGDPALQNALETALEEAGVDVFTHDPIVEATRDTVHFEDRDQIEADLLVWTGGISGSSVEAGLERERSRFRTDATFQTSADHVYAIGDCALVETPDGEAPPTAQAAMQAGRHLADVVSQSTAVSAEEPWTYTDRGTLVSVGEDAYASNVFGFDVGVIDGAMARFLKKGVAVRWLASITSWQRAIRAWDAL
ncbi:MAG: NAD(P)/FAD-dependent oxidoreductase [Halanaeroarchaeum sp.]